MPSPASPPVPNFISVPEEYRTIDFPWKKNTPLSKNPPT